VTMVRWQAYATVAASASSSRLGRAPTVARLVEHVAHAL
jgi:hypothetical protein